MEGKAGTIHSDVYQAYSDNLRKAVGGVFSGASDGRYADLEAQLQANVTRFAAYKAYHLTEQLKKKREEWTNDDDFKNIAKAMMNTFNRYQAAEYNTATARARTAKQWNDFNADPIANELYPNLRWLPSRSANPREEHQAFYWLVLPKTDDFWKQNQPGNLWNCKCDWEETDAPIDTKELKADDLAKARSEGGGIHANGLEGNPAVTGEIFTQGCTYFKQVPTTDEFAKKINITGRNYARKTNFTKYTVQSDIGEIYVNKKSFKESVKANTNAETKSYYLKNEIVRHLDVYISKFQRDPIPEGIDLHNIPGSEAYDFKSNCKCMHVFRGTVHGLPIILKVAELKKNGKLILYSCHL